MTTLEIVLIILDALFTLMLGVAFVGGVLWGRRVWKQGE